ncbi:MAG: tape measure protein, partial [Solimonas sp.]
MQQITELSREIDAVGQVSDEVRAEAGKLTSALADLSRQQTVVEVFQQLDAKATAAGTALAGLQAKAQASAEAQARLSSNLEASRAALSLARDAASSLGSDLQRSSVAVKESEARYKSLNEELRRTGKGNEDLKLAVAAARAELDASRATHRQINAALKDTEKAHKDLERAVLADERAFKAEGDTAAKLVPQVESAATAHRQLQVDVDRARNALRYAGVEAGNLAGEQQRITRQTIETRSAVSELTERLRQERGELDGVSGKAREAAAATDRLGTQQEKAARQSDPLVTGLKHAGHAMSGFVAASLGLNETKQFIQSILATGDRFERFGKQLASTFGSAEAGEAAFQWVREFAKNTPLELDQVLDATVKLKNFGLDPMDGTLQALVDQNARLGGSQEVLNRIILATGQAFAKGRLQGEELLQFAEAGVPVFDLLSKQLGKTTAEVIEMAKKGELGRDVIKRLIEEIGKSSAGAAADQMATLGGQISNLKDRYTEFLNLVAQAGALDDVKTELQALGEDMDDSAGAVEFMSGAVRTLMGLLVALAGTVRISFN